VFNITFSNISVISWWQVLLVEETRLPKETTDLSQVTDKLHMTLYQNLSFKLLKELFNDDPLKKINLDLGDVMIVWQLNLPVQSVHITTKVVSLNPADGEVCSIQHI
jgi:hypothetical protein